MLPGRKSQPPNQDKASLGAGPVGGISLPLPTFLTRSGSGSLSQDLRSPIGQGCCRLVWNSASSAWGSVVKARSGSGSGVLAKGWGVRRVKDED